MYRKIIISISSLFLVACSITAPAVKDTCSGLNQKAIQAPAHGTNPNNFLQQYQDAQAIDQAKRLAKKYHCQDK